MIIRIKEEIRAEFGAESLLLTSPTFVSRIDGVFLSLISLASYSRATSGITTEDQK